MRPRAFTTVELVVVVAIIAVLIALTLPAVQYAREAARTTQCLNNMRQIGIALHNYHEQHNALPPAVIWSGPPGEPLGGGQLTVGLFDRVALGLAPDSEPSRVHANWVIMLLPSLEQSGLYNQFDVRRPVSDPANEQARMTELPVMKCPTDSFGGAGNLYVRNWLAGTKSNSYARGNYALNIGPDRGCIIDLSPNCDDGFAVDSIDLANANMRVWGTGVGGVNTSFSFADIEIGLANMVAVDEIRAGLHAVDPRGTWALGFPGASATARHGLFEGSEDANGPNNQHPDADDIVGCTALHNRFGSDEPTRLGMPCFVPPDPADEVNAQATARSMHTSGVHVLTAAGSAHFVSDNVNAEVWHRIHSRRDNGPVDAPF